MRERERRGGRKRAMYERYMDQLPPSRDLAHNPGMYPNWESNRQPFGSQAGTQSTETHPPGPTVFSLMQRSRT